MKKIKINIKKLLSIKNQIKLAIYFIGLTVVACSLLLATVNLYRFVKDPIGQDKLIASSSLSIPKAKAQIKEYKYNENVPEEVILDEAKTLSERFDLNYDKWESLLRCEATCTKSDHEEVGCELGKLSNLVRNRTSTAVGLGEYLINTWYATESWKQERKARTDYKASLWEMALDLSNGEQDKWQECLVITGIYEFRR